MYAVFLLCTYLHMCLHVCVTCVCLYLFIYISIYVYKITHMSFVRNVFQNNIQVCAGCVCIMYIYVCMGGVCLHIVVCVHMFVWA